MACRAHRPTGLFIYNDRQRLMEPDKHEPLAKLLAPDESGVMAPFTWGKAYRYETYYWGNRIMCSTDEDRIDWLVELASRYPGPFDLNYILEDESGRHNYPEGRYMKSSVSLDQLKFFFHEFHDFLAFDGRHHVMVHCNTTRGMVVFDQHDYFYVYGGLDSLLQDLKQRGFIERSFVLGRHGHPIKEESPDLHRLMEFWPWNWRALEATDITKERLGFFQNLRLQIRSRWHSFTHRFPK
jgi:hypothetical protein